MGETTEAEAEVGTVEMGFGDLVLDAGSHVGHFYQTDRERLDLAVPFLAHGVERGDRCVYLAQPERSREDLLASLSDEGIDVGRALDEGRLDVRGGLGDPAELERLLTDNAELVPSAHPMLRWGGDMRWSRDEMKDSRALMQWETACNTFRHRERAVFFCQYPLSEFSGDVVMDALQTHPVTIVGRSVQRNSLYREPDQFLADLEGRAAPSHPEASA